MEVGPIDIKLFSDAYDTLKKVFGDVAVLSSFPRKERDQYRRVLDETFTLLDSALLLVYNRLGDVLIRSREGDTDQVREKVASELGALANVAEWETLNRNVRLCSNLRETGREMNGLVYRLKSKLAVHDSNALDHIIRAVLEGEGRLADWIGAMLQSLAAIAPEAKTDLKKIGDVLQKTREGLRSERMKLIKLQTEMYEAI